MTKKSLCFISIILALLMAASAFSVMQAYAADTSKAAVADDDDDYDDETDEGYLSTNSITIKAGEAKTVKFYENGHDFIGANSMDKSIAKAVEKTSGAVIYGLKKGKTKVMFYDMAYSYSADVKVTTNPTIKVGGKKFKASKTYTVKKGKTLTVKITGKASIVKNKYSSSKKSVAKVISKNTAKTVKIKGYKKGSAKVTIKVNGVAFKIKVKVKAK